MNTEIIWTTRPINDEIEIGFIGGPLYRVNRFKLQMAILDRKVKDTPEDVLKYAIKESQYIEFEEVKPKIILLGLENNGTDTNETK